MAKEFEGIPRCGYWELRSGELGEVAKQLRVGDRQLASGRFLVFPNLGRDPTV
jgi:hypothetical protein